MPKAPTPAPEHTPLKDRKKLLIYCTAVIAVAAVFTAIAIALMVRAPEHPSNGSSVRIDGVIECLPHKGDGPHTLECAYGLRTDDDRHYSLKNTTNVTTYSVDTPVRVEGTIHSNPNSQYDIVGEIDVKEISTR